MPVPSSPVPDPAVPAKKARAPRKAPAAKAKPRTPKPKVVAASALAPTPPAPAADVVVPSADKPSWFTKVLGLLAKVTPFKTWADARAFLYILTPIAASAFVTAGWFTNNLANLAVPLALAALNWPIQASQSLATWRTYIYNILGAVNVLAIGLGWWTDNTWSPWVGLGGMVITNVLAHWFTPTTGTPPNNEQVQEIRLAAGS